MQKNENLYQIPSNIIKELTDKYKLDYLTII